VTLGCLLLAQHPLAGALGDAFSNGVDARFWGLVETLRLNDGIEKSVAAAQKAFRMALAPHCSPCMLDFLLRCVHADPSKRPTCEKLLDHAFVRQHLANASPDGLATISSPCEPHIDAFEASAETMPSLSHTGSPVPRPLYPIVVNVGADVPGPPAMTITHDLSMATVAERSDLIAYIDSDHNSPKPTSPNSGATARAESSFEFSPSFLAPSHCASAVGAVGSDPSTVVAWISGSDLRR
jgi:serine/threonine protein kinase